MRKMKRLNLIKLISLVMVFLFAISSPALAKKPSANERLLYKLLNEKRQEQGLKKLRRGKKIEVAARRHSRDMVENNFFSHVGQDGENLADRLRKARVKGWKSAGENLAGAGSVEVAFDLWLASPAHRNNMLRSNYTNVGIDVTEGGPYGLMITMDFIQKH
jgi:uncharacterized protein YkwD